MTHWYFSHPSLQRRYYEYTIIFFYLRLCLLLYTNTWLSSHRILVFVIGLRSFNKYFSHEKLIKQILIQTFFFKLNHFVCNIIYTWVYVYMNACVCVCMNCNTRTYWQSLQRRRITNLQSEGFLARSDFKLMYSCFSGFVTVINYCYNIKYFRNYALPNSYFPTNCCLPNM